MCSTKEPKDDGPMTSTKTFIKTIAIIMIICILLSGSVSARQDDKIPVIIVFKDTPTKGLAQAQSVQASSIQQVDGEIEHRFHVINAVSAKMSPQAINALSKNKDILYIEPDIEVHALSQSVSWGVNRVDALSVHPFNKGAGIKIAVVDSGIDYTHPDLNDNYKGGYDFVNNDNDPMDDHGHGTKVAGIIAAEDNAFGVLGVAPEASIYGLKVLRSDGVGYSSNIIRAIEWAVDNDMDIVSMSIGSNAGSYAYQQAVNNAYNSGVLLVASAGNSGSTATDNVMYPAKYDSVIAISAMNQVDGICSFSSVGPAVELTAPGIYLKTTAVGGGYYNYFAGTSAAAPFVSGVAALMMASDPTLTNVEIREQLRDNAIDLGESGRDIKYGYGLPIAIGSTPSLLDVEIAGVGQIDSGQNTQVTIRVSSGGLPVEGAMVSISSPLGQLSPETGTTNANGNIVATYKAPHVTTRTYTSISATATKTGYTEGSNTNIITINSPQVAVQQLDVTLTQADTTLEVGQNTQVTIHATSEGAVIAGAEVVVSVSGGNLVPGAGTTDANGNFIATYTAPQVTAQTGFAISAVATKSGYDVGSASGIIRVNPESSSPTPGPIDAALPESSHPYPNSYDNTWVISEPGAEKMRIHFADLKTEARYDFVYIYDRNNVEVARYDGYYEDIWTPWVTGDTIKVRLTSDASSIRNGFIVDLKETVNTGLPQLDVTMTQTDTTLETGQNTQVIIHVSNGGTPVTGATAVVSASGGYLVTATGTTNANGDFITTYTAPQVTSHTEFTISATTTKTGYSMGAGSNTITVNPPQVSVQQLDVYMTWVDSTLDAGQNTQVTIHASSEGMPVAGAMVGISASGGYLNPTMGTTDANGNFIATYTAPPVTVQTGFSISAVATKSGYATGSASGSITVNPESSSPTPDPIDAVLPESPRPYPNSYDNTWTITEPGAEKIRIHFADLKTEARYDFVYIYDKNDVQIARYDGYYEDIWTPWVTGDTIKVRLTTDESSIRNGFIVDMKESTHI